MRENLPVTFTDELVKKTRNPILLARIEASGTTFYLSSEEYTADGNTYKPWVASWGELSANISYYGFITRGDLEAEYQSVEIIKFSDSMPFIRHLFNVGVENATLVLYQTFKDLDYSDKVLVGEFLLQDPIELSSKAVGFKLSSIRKSLGKDEPLVDPVAGAPELEYVVGKVENMRLQDTHESVLTTLTESLAKNYLGKIYCGNTVGLPVAASGYLRINEEVVAYDTYTETTVNIINRGTNGTTASDHSSGSAVCQYYSAGLAPSFIYNVCAGPVNSIDNLRIVGTDGQLVSYQHPDHVVFNPDQNPANVTFTRRPPWITSEAEGNTIPITPDPVTEPLYASKTESFYSPATIPSVTGEVFANMDNNHFATMWIQSSEGGGVSEYKSYAVDVDTFNSGIYSFGNWDKIMSHGNFPDTFFFTVMRYIPKQPETISITIPSGGGTDTFQMAEGVQPPDGIVGEIGLEYISDKNTLGTLTKQEITFRIDAHAKGVEIKLEIIIVDNPTNGGAENVVQTYTHDATGDIVFGETPSWGDILDVKTFDITNIITSFDDLLNSKLIFRFTMVSMFEDDRSKATCYIRDTQYISTYEKTPVEFPTQELVAHFDREIEGNPTNVQVNITYQAELNNAETTIYFVGRSTDDPLDNATFGTKKITASTDDWLTETFYPSGITTPAQLAALRFGIRHELTGPTDTSLRNSTVRVQRIEFVITSQGPDYLDVPERHVMIAENLVVDVVGAGGENETPPDFIARILGVTLTNLTDAQNFYTGKGWYLNGLLPGGVTKSEAAREGLRQGMGRLAYSGNDVKYIQYAEVDTTAEPDHIFDYPDADELDFDYGMMVKNEPQSAIKTDITVKHSYDNLNSFFSGSSNAAIAGSEVIEQKKTYEYGLVSSQTVADTISQRLLDMLSKPASVYTFQCALDTGFVREKNDFVAFPNFLTGNYSKGFILDVKRKYCAGKNRQMDKFQIRVVNPILYNPVQLLGDDWDDPIIITGPNSGTYNGTTVGMTWASPGQEGEQWMGPCIWVKFTAPESNWYKANVTSSDFDPRIMAFEESGVPVESSMTPLADTELSPVSEFPLFVYLSSGVSMYIQIGVYDSVTDWEDEGAFTLTWWVP